MTNENRRPDRRDAYAVALALLVGESSSASSSGSNDNGISTDDDGDLDVVMKSECGLYTEIILALQDQSGWWWVKLRGDHWVKR